jgi:hypothetical protein
MKHTIEGKNVCITGTLEVYDRAGAERAILDAGGTIAKSVGPRTDLLIVGKRAGSKLAKARKLGIPIIEEADLASFLAGDAVESEDIVASGDASVRDLIGEARAALDGPHDSETWSAILELVDACAPDALPGLIAYLEPQIARWEMTPTTRWTPKKGSHGTENQRGGWLHNAPLGELRMAPHSWITEMISGHDVPKHALVRGVHLYGLDANARVCKEVVSRAHLTNLRVLDLARSDLSSVFWHALRKLETLRSLERLHLTIRDAKNVKAVDGGHHLTGLSELVVRLISTSAKLLHALLGAELAQGITTLTLESTWPNGLDTLDASYLPDLTALRFLSPTDGRVRAAIDHPLTARVGHLIVAKPIAVRHHDDPDADVLSTLSAWTDGATAGPARLDLSQVTFQHVSTTRLPIPYDDDLARAALARAAADWDLPPATTTVALGPWWSDGLAEVLSDKGVEATR